MAQLLLFAAVREAAGQKSAQFSGQTVGEVLRFATSEFGSEFERLVDYCQVFVGDERVDSAFLVGADTEIALLPPVAGGAY